MNDMENDVKTLLKQAVSAVDKAQKRADTFEYGAREPIAIVGMSCRLPGGVDSPESYWRLLSRGEDAVTEVPADRWDLGAWYSPDPEAPGRMYARHGGFVADIVSFDPTFFGISPREALRIDPQHRLLLEVAWEALERAGIAPARLAGARAGVFVGVTGNDYGDVLAQSGALDAYYLTGNALNFAAGRLAYTLGMRGPSLAVDTACSSSLVALHLGCKSLRDRECDLVLVGGVNAILSPKGHVLTCKARMQSPTGRCRAFDAGADGMVRGEGCGVVALKRLSDAVRDGDRIEAVIRGSAVNQGGASGGLTVPSKDAQRAVIVEALARASVSPTDVDYVEAHGTGTPLGDPIELRALAEVFAPGRDAGRPLLVGSVKTNIGHLESAAGMAGVMKTVLALQHRQVPAHLHVETPTPHFGWDRAPLQVPTRLTHWPASDGAALAGVSSFGGSGTNAHVVLESAPPRAEAPDRWKRPLHVLALSAKDLGALRELTRRYCDLLTDDTLLADVAHTAGAGRSHHALRRAVFAGSSAEARAALASVLSGSSAPSVVETAPGQVKPLRVAFLFSGQGSQYAGMGAALYGTQPMFTETLDRCSELLEPRLSRSLASALASGEPSDEELVDTRLAQPALYALQVSLAAMWRSWGIEPAAVLGHSVGEIAAAHVAGMLSLEDGLLLAAERGRLMSELPRGGAMAAVQASAEVVRGIVAGWRERLAIAAINGPRSTVISGGADALAACRGALAARAIETKPLEVSHAFHSPLLDPMLDALEAVVSKLTLAAPAIPLVSGITGRALGAGEGLRPSWWRRQAREPVEFQRGMETLGELGCDGFVEVGPQATLLALGADCLGEAHGAWLPSLRRKRDDWQQVLLTLATLYARGADVDWDAFDRGYGLRRVLCPVYPFQRQRFWPEAASHPAPGAAPGRIEVPLDEPTRALLADHRIYGEVIVPGSFHLSEVLGRLEPSAVVEVTDVAFQEALALDDAGADLPLLRIVRGGDDPASFRVESVARGEADAGSVAHVVGRVRAVAPTPRPDEDAPVTTEQLIERCEAHVRGEDFYAAFAAAGVGLGPAFRWIAELWIGPGRAVARMRAVEECARDGGSTAPPPGLVDSLFQLLAAAGRSDRRSDSVFIPYLLEKMTLRAPCRGELWAHAELRPDAVAEEGACTFAGNLRLVDGAGSVVLEASGLYVRAAPRHALQSGRRRRVRRWLHRIAWVPAPVRDDRPIAGRWLVLADQTGVGAELARVLQDAGAQCVRVDRGETFARLGDDHFSVDPRRPADFAAVRDAFEAGGGAPTGIVHLWSLDVAPISDASASARVDQQLAALCDGALHCVQVLAQGFPAAPRLFLVTRGAQCVDDLETGTSPVQAALWGLGRTVRAEHSELGCVLVDLDPSRAPSASDVAPILGAGAEEDELALRGGRSWVPRLEPVDGDAATLVTGDRPTRLVVPQRGSIANVVAEPIARRAPGAGEVEIEIAAAGVNFRDVLNVLGMYPGNPGPLGGEIAGRIAAVGDGVDGLRPGDRVAAVFPGEGGFATHATVPAAQAVPLPDGVSFTDAAAAPVAFLTAWYGLLELGGLAAAERVLIHAAAGGVGLAAVQLALRAGAEVFATAGTPRKRAFLRRLGVPHVMNSRSVGFAGEVLALTGGEGVDLVLNSLTGDALHQSLTVLKPGGRFMELGKREILSDSDLAALGRPVRYQPFDIIDVARRGAGRFRELLARIFADLEAGSLQPLPRKVFPLRDARRALRHLATARHIGKVVLRGEAHPAADLPIRADGTYIVSGGTGALGLHTAAWLASRGARHLVLVARRAPREEAALRIDRLRGQGVEVAVGLADVGRRDELEATLSRVLREMPPVRGVVHAAGVVDDGMLRDQDGARFAAVALPKALGAWALHELTLEAPLDFFVLYASASALTGSMGQSNYTAANAFLDALAHRRRQEGRVAHALDWGPWAGAGMAAETASRGRARWSDMGLEAMAPAKALTALELALEQDEPQLAVLSLRRDGPASGYVARAPSLLGELLEGRGGPKRESKAEGAGRAAVEWVALPPGERRPKLQLLVSENVARALGLSPQQLDPGRPLADLGLDSLMATELRNALGGALGCPIPIASLIESPTVNGLVAQLDRLLTENAAAAPTASAKPDGDTTSHRSRRVTSLQVLEERSAPLMQRLEQARSAGVYYFETPITRLDGEGVTCAGGEWKLMFATYSYLGLLGHPAIVQAAKDAVERYGTGTHGVRLNGGTLELHKQLEARIARFLGREAAITFSSGFMTNCAAVTTLVGPGDWVIGDQWNHASIVDGCRASGAVFRVYPHGDMDELERILQEAPSDVVRLVIADAVFSLDGDILDLPRAVEICRRHDALLMIDEAHSLGVLGASGRGVEEHFGMPGAIDVCMGTLSKTIPAVGGYIAASADLVTYLRFKARGYVFSAAMAPPVAAAALTAFDVLEAEGTERRGMLARNVELFLGGLNAAGFNTGRTCTPIIPVIVGSEENAMALTQHCQERGLFAMPVMPPAVPLNTARLRLNVMATHTRAELERALAIIIEGGRSLPRSVPPPATQLRRTERAK